MLSAVDHADHVENVSSPCSTYVDGWRSMTFVTSPGSRCPLLGPVSIVGTEDNPLEPGHKRPWPDRTVSTEALPAPASCAFHPPAVLPALVVLTSWTRQKMRVHYAQQKKQQVKENHHAEMDHQTSIPSSCVCFTFVHDPIWVCMRLFVFVVEHCETKISVFMSTMPAGMIPAGLCIQCQ